MTRFRIDGARFGPYPTVELADAECGTRLSIARRGATLLSFRVMHAGHEQELADSYRDPTDFEALGSARFAWMAPFANRIAAARYGFDGESFDMQPGVEGAGRGIRHGYVRGVEFELVASHADDEAATVTLRYSGLRPGAHAGWPFAVDLTVTYRLHAGGLDMALDQHNVGERSAPSFCGWHPYFRVGNDAIDGWELEIPASHRVRTDADLIPLPGEAALEPLEQCPDYDFRHRRPLGPIALDVAYAGLRADADGCMRTSLWHPDSGLGIRVWQHGGVLLAFTGDGLPRGPRGSLALEPMEAMTNAYNRPEWREAISLAPGETRRFECGVEVISA